MILSDRIFCGPNDLVILEGSFAVGATGAVSAVKGNGVSGVVRNSAGNYTITLLDAYNKFFGFAHTFFGTTGSGISSVQVASETVASTKTIVVQTYVIKTSDDTLEAGDPADGCTLRFVITLRRSSLKGKGE